MRRIAVLSLTAFLTLLHTRCAVINRATGIAQAQELAQIGEPARAEILQIWDTGMTLNGNPVVGMRLRVQPSVGETWEAETKGVVPRLQVCQVQPGNEIVVRFDPADPARVSLAYERR